MSYADAMKTAITNHLNQHYVRAGELPVRPNDVIDLELHWDSGDRPDPTYGGSTTEPTLEVRVKVERPIYVVGNPGRAGSQFNQVDVSVELVFTALLRAILETGL